MAAAPNDYEAFFRKADLDGDGQISGAEAVAFFQGSGLSKPVLAQVWAYADQRKAGYLGRQEFYNALKLVTVAQSQRSLTPDIVKAALYGPAASKIPAPKINIASATLRQAPSSSMESSTTSSHLSQSSTIRPQSTSPQSLSSSQSQVTGSALSNPSVPRNQPQPFFVQPRGIGPAASSAELIGASKILPNLSQIRPSMPLDTQHVVGLTGTGFSSAGQPEMALKKTVSTNQALLNPVLPSEQGLGGSRSSAGSMNGYSSESLFGDTFSADPVRQSQISTESKMSSTPVIVPGVFQPSSIPGTFPLRPGTYSQQSAPVQTSEAQNRKNSGQNLSPVQPSAYSVESRSISNASQSPWPKMTSSDINKYVKVFLQVDSDRDGKITGEQARNLFLSWRLPREILKQIWDLSDQDSDNMLSLKEFCVAVYLMERYREGRALPATVPNSVTSDETLLSILNHTSTFFGAANVKPIPAVRHPPANSSARPPSGAPRPPRPPVPHIGEDRQTSLQKPKMPSLEKALLHQLSEEEQNTLNSKLKEVSEADKKVGELEKEISESRQKIDFFRSKMQELVIYKSRCDNRLNEVSARVSSDRREADNLAKQYEEKCKQAGDVASRLTLEEATFRDIQEKKMELYRAIVKMEEGAPSGDVVKERVTRIQSGLEELMKSLNERCKLYGLRSNPTSLVELPFGWQPGLQEGAADLDEDWDKFDDEGFTFVKEFTLEVPNVVASPKKPSAATATATSDGDQKPQIQSIPNGSPTAEKSVDHSIVNGMMKSPPDSPNTESTEHKSHHDFPLKNSAEDSSPRHTESHSELGNSGVQNVNNQKWNSFDETSAFGFDPFSKESDVDTKSETSNYDISGLGLNPIRTMLPSENRSLFADSAPTTPAYDIGKSGFADSALGTPAYSRNIFADSVPSTPLYNQSFFMESVPSTPVYNQAMNSSIFADSVPSTPAYNNSPRRFSDHSFDSFDIHDGGLFQSSNPTLSRFDSMRSSVESEFGYGFGSQYDSNQDQRGSFSRFDSFSSADKGEGFSRFDSFRDSDSEISRGFSKFDSFSVKDDGDSGTPKTSDSAFGYNSFDDADLFGSGGPFKSSFDGETPRKTHDSWAF